MKRIAFTALLSVMAATLSYSVYFERGIIDPELVGTWEGSSSVGERSGEVREWIQIRKRDGTVISHFTVKKGEEIVDSYTTSGWWWATDGKFSETFSESKKEPDIYRYEFTSPDSLRFTLLSNEGQDSGFEPYTFTETRANKAGAHDVQKHPSEPQRRYIGLY